MSAPVASEGSILAIGAPDHWNWAYFRSVVMWRGRFRLFHVPVRYRATVALIAQQHGLAVRILEDGTLEVVLLEENGRLRTPNAERQKAYRDRQREPNEEGHRNG